jgi:hypothetical protein
VRPTRICRPYLAEDIVNLETGEIYVEAGDEIWDEETHGRQWWI